MVSNGEFNRSLRWRRRLKFLLAWPVVVAGFWLSYEQITAVIDLKKSLGEISTAEISGMMNNISPFIMLIICGFAMIIPFFLIHPSAEAILKGSFSTPIGKMITGSIFVVTLGYAIWLNSAIKEGVIAHGYTECRDERALTSKYSSRTYVLPPMTCEQLSK